MTTEAIRRALLSFTLFSLVAGAVGMPHFQSIREECAPAAQDAKRAAAEDKGLQVHYLEIVTPDVDETCEALAKMHGTTFSEPVAAFGNARTAALSDGGRIGVRAPMRAD